MKQEPGSQVAIVGAGPYGLAAAAHLTQAGVETRTFGEPMEFWDRRMPPDMRLRSEPSASQIGALSEHSIGQYYAEGGQAAPHRMSRQEFVAYGKWVQERAVPDVDRRRVTQVERAGKGFRLWLEGGDAWRAERVVVAAGIGPFARRPLQFLPFPRALVSHSSDPEGFAPPPGSRVVIVGGGQSALEIAALLAARDVEVEVVVRSPDIRWLASRPDGGSERTVAGLSAELRHVLRLVTRPPLDIMGPRFVSWLMAWPRLYRLSPGFLQRMLTARAVRPAVADWVLPRLSTVRLTTGRSVTEVTRTGSRIHLRLDDWTPRTVDHVILATGYRIDIRSYGFLSTELLSGIRTGDGYPVLGPGFESSVPGLHFLGTPAARTFGPMCRFVVGTGYAGRALARRVVPSRRAARPVPVGRERVPVTVA